MYVRACIRPSKSAHGGGEGQREIFYIIILSLAVGTRSAGTGEAAAVAHSKHFVEARI